ncbi:hypothetical protein V3C99_014740 [Haemonchus contortus]
MEWMLLLSSILHTLTEGLGLATNALLIYLVLTKTPKRLTTYSILILNFAICDLLTCVSAFFVQQRLIPGGTGLFYFSHGPCKLFGSLTCYIGYSFMLHCYSHWLWSLLFSFVYRYYILGHSAPKTRTVVIIITLLYIPSFFQFVTFCFASDDVTEVKNLIVKKFGYDVSKESVSGHLNIFDWKIMFTILHMTLPITPVYTAILILRRMTLAKLRAERVMSENSKHLHAQLLKALTIQACLPIFFLIAVITYTIGQLGIHNHPLLEYATFLLGSFIPMLSPVTSFYFVRPYRLWIRNRLLCMYRKTSSQSLTRTTTLYGSQETSKGYY